MQRVANANVSRSFTYDSYSRLSRESVTIDSLTRTSGYSYDDYHRPTAVTYPAGEVITTTYGSPGAAVGLSSSVHGALIDSVSYDEAGRMTALHFPAGGNLWRTQSYYPWTEPQNGGMLESLKVGLSEGNGERLSRGYAYNGFGDITALTEGTTSNSFTYDGLGRLTSAYGRTYSYDGASRLTSFNGQAYGYGDSGPHHAVDRIGNADRFDYDANGNMTVRNKGLAGQQTLVWDAQNRLSQVQDNNGDLLEQYWYDVDGARAKKTSGTTTTCTFFVHYEEEVTGGVTTTVSHYSFGGLRIAVKRGNDLFHLHCDHLGSTSLTTDGAGAATASRAYYAYGAERAASGVLQIDHTFTGQKRDSTGLMYYNARYYDPALGTFISPDPIIPDPGMVIDYNRFLYVRGNPFKYTDPSGRDLVCIKGGPSGMNADKNAFFLWCLEVAIRAGWDEEKHGPIHFIDNDKASTAAVADEISESRKEFPDRPIVAVGHSWGGIGVLNFARSLHADRINVDLVLVLDLEDFGRWGYTRPDQSVALSHNIEAGANLYPQHIGTEYDDIGRYDDGVNEIVYSDGTPVLNLGIGKVMTAGGFVEATHYNVFSARETIAIAAWHLMGVLGEGGGGAVDRGLLGEPLHQFL